MKLAVIGSGNIGKSIGTWASKEGYEVIFSSRNPEHAKEAAAKAGNKSRSDTVIKAVNEADLILLAVPYSAIKEVASEIDSSVSGKTVIDATNPLSSDYSSLTVGFSSCAAEEIQKLVPGAKVVKAFNSVFASVFASQNPERKGRKVTVFYAGDDGAAKSKVADLITKMGFDAVDCGALKSSRLLEPLALLNVSLGYSQGFGTDIGFSVLR